MENFNNLVNNNSSEENLKEKLESLRDIINFYYLPLIVSIGIIGNLLSILIFTFEQKLASFNDQNMSLVQNLEKLCEKNPRKRNRISKLFKIQMHSSNYFICFLAISDLVYNIILACVWITKIGFNILDRKYICQLSVMISYICSFLSAAFTIMFTFQRFMAVVNPLQLANNFINSKRIIIQSTFGLIVFSCLVYSFSIFAYDTSAKKDHEASVEQEICGINQAYTNFVYILDNTLDSFLTLIIPAIGITVMNVAICRSMMGSYKENILASQCSNNDKISTANAGNCLPNETRANSKESLNVQINDIKSTRNDINSNKNKNTFRHVTKMLLIVSFTFLLLNSPFRLSKLVSYIHMSIKKNYVYSNLEFVINEVLINLYFTSYSVNFFLYSLCGKKFKQSLRGLLIFVLYGFYKIIKQLKKRD